MLAMLGEKVMILIDENGWITPECIFCQGMMEFNYHRWIGTTIMNADFNLYCRECHYAVSIEPATTDKSCKHTKHKITVYNNSQCLQEEEQ